MICYSREPIRHGRQAPRFPVLWGPETDIHTYIRFNIYMYTQVMSTKVIVIKSVQHMNVCPMRELNPRPAA